MNVLGMKAMMEEETDVRRVIEIEAFGTGFRYVFETTFPTFPRYVIGTCDEFGNNCRQLVRCGSEWNALRLWQAREPFSPTPAKHGELFERSQTELPA